MKKKVCMCSAFYFNIYRFSCCFSFNFLCIFHFSWTTSFYILYTFPFSLYLILLDSFFFWFIFTSTSFSVAILLLLYISRYILIYLSGEINFFLSSFKGFVLLVNFSCGKIFIIFFVIHIWVKIERSTFLFSLTKVRL